MNVAKQLLSGHTCSTCKYIDYYYSLGDTIYMCNNPVRTRGTLEIPSLKKLDERGTCEEWIL